MKFIRYSKFKGFDVFGLDLGSLMDALSEQMLGSGRASFSLPPIARVDEALLTPISVHRLDDEVLFDCDLSAQRVPVGRAKKST